MADRLYHHYEENAVNLVSLISSLITELKIQKGKLGDRYRRIIEPSFYPTTALIFGDCREIEKCFFS